MSTPSQTATEYNKSQKGLSLETKNTQNHERLNKEGPGNTQRHNNAMSMTSRRHDVAKT